jgi:hypothetical protein
MKLMRFVSIAVALLFCVPVFSQIKPCEELKSEIDAKIKEKGVTNFTLEIVPADQVKDQKEVGSCDGGKNKITYSKEAKETGKEVKEDTKEVKKAVKKAAKKEVKEEQK